MEIKNLDNRKKAQPLRILLSKLFPQSDKILRRPGIEPGSTAWKAAMLTTIPPTLCCRNRLKHNIDF